MARRPKWAQLDYFRAVGRTQHITRAAQELGVSQPAVSRAIAGLEADLGIRLFEHNGRSIRLTADGAIFLSHVERAFDLIENGVEALRDPAGDGSGRVTIGSLRTLGYHFVPQLIRRFRRRYPNVQVSLQQDNSAHLEEKLIAGRVDVILTTRIQDRAACAWQELGVQELQLLVPETHRLANRDEVTLNDVRDEAFVCLEVGHNYRTLVDGVFVEAGIAPRISFECDDGHLMGFVAAELGIAIVPPYYTTAEGLKLLKIVSPSARRSIGISWLNGHYLSGGARALLGFAGSAIRPDLTFEDLADPDADTPQASMFC